LVEGTLPTGLRPGIAGFIFGTPTTEGVFNFTVKAQNNVDFDTKNLSIKITSLGVTENEISKITIFPNPTNSQFSILNSHPEFNSGSILSVEVFDVYGRKLSHPELNSGSFQIDISSLSAGVYFVKITTEADVVVKKIMKH